MSRTVLIASGGTGRYSDPWHPYRETSERLAAVLTGQGFDVRVSERVDQGLSALDDVDLLVVNAGTSPDRPPDDAADSRTRQGLLDYVSRGGPVLAMHSSASAFPAMAEWETLVGGRWVDGTTMHPPISTGHITVHPDRHPIVAMSDHFDVYDERYSHLRVAGDVVALATHRHDGVDHPLLWARHHGRASVVYDALGHNGRSYDSPEHAAIIGRAARWLVGELA